MEKVNLDRRISAMGDECADEKTYDKFVVVCIAGQSNAVGYDESPIDTDATCRNADPDRIKQLVQ